MKRAWVTSGIAVSSVLLLGVPLAAVASCATNAEVGDVHHDAATPLPPNMPADAALDGACDPSDADCTKEMAACESVSWCLTSTPLSPQHRLTAAWGTGKEDVWAVGSGGTILHYDGSKWAATPTGVRHTLHNVWGSGPRDIWVVSSTTLVLHGTGFRNGTAQWDRVPAPYDSSTSSSPPNPSPIYALWGSSRNDVRVGTEAFRLDIASAEFSYSGPSNQLVMSLGQDGSMWRALPGTGHYVRSIWGSSASDVWMSVDNSKQVPGQRGLTFHGVPYEGPRPNPGIRDDPACQYCSLNCTQCAIVDDPLEWTPIESQSQDILEAIWGSSADDVWSVGERGTIRRFRKGDEVWQKVDSPTTRDLHAVWGSGPNDVWIAGDGGTILHYDGVKVTHASAQFPVGPKPVLRGIWGSGPDDVWIVGDVVLHYTGPKPGVDEGGGM